VNKSFKPLEIGYGEHLNSTTVLGKVVTCQFQSKSAMDVSVIVKFDQYAAANIGVVSQRERTEIVKPIK
jgi:hypothetical protein